VLFVAIFAMLGFMAVGDGLSTGIFVKLSLEVLVFIMDLAGYTDENTQLTI
jgi:hypothetical protein